MSGAPVESPVAIDRRHRPAVDSFLAPTRSKSAAPRRLRGDISGRPLLSLPLMGERRRKRRGGPRLTCRRRNCFRRVGGRRQSFRSPASATVVLIDSDEWMAVAEGRADAPRANFYRMDARLAGSDRRPGPAAILDRNICCADVFGQSLRLSRVVGRVLLSGAASPGIYWNPRHGVDKINLPSAGHIEAPGRNKLGRSMHLGVVIGPIFRYADSKNSSSSGLFQRLGSPVRSDCHW